MKIYVGHSSGINYRKDLYKPLRNSDLNEKHTIVLPHEDSDEPFDSKEFLKNECDLFIAEVSEVSTGLGIEIGWADTYDVPILCIHREDSEFSSSLPEVADKIRKYNSESLLETINELVKEK